MRIAVGLVAITAWLALEASDATLEARGGGHAGGGGARVVVVPAPSGRSAPSVGARGATVKGATVHGATVKGATVKGATVKGATVKGATVKGATNKAATTTSTWWYFSENNPTYEPKCTKAKQRKGACHN